MPRAPAAARGRGTVLPSPTLTIITLNTWGLLAPASRDRVSRVSALASRLAITDADIVCLQEVWVSADADALTAAGRAGGLPHAVRFRSGPFGSGLLTLSRHPITSSCFTPYGAAGDPLAIAQGDAVAGKGVGVVVVEVEGGRGEGVRVAIANTHLAAAYRDAHGLPPTSAGRRRNTLKTPPFTVPGDANGGVRVAQVVAAATTLRGAAAAAGASAGLLVGDINAPPHSLEAALVGALLGGAADAWAVAGDSKDPHSGTTANRPGAAYAATAGAGKQPTRIDYVWCVGGVAAASAEVVWGGGDAVSDHVGLRVVVHAGAAESGGDTAHPAWWRPPVAPTGRGALVAAATLLESAAATSARQGDAALAAAAAAALSAAALALALTVAAPASLAAATGAVTAAAVLGFAAACLFWGGYAGRHALAAALTDARTAVGVLLGDVS